MESIKYEALVKAAELGSITKAAYDLGYTQSNITQMIRKLESEVGLTLLHRTANGVVLTEEGKRLMPYMQEQLVLQERIRQESALLQGMETGIVRVGSYPVFVANAMAGICRAMHEKHPNINVEIIDGLEEELVPMLESGTLDIAVVAPQTSKETESIFLTELEWLALMPEDHPLCRFEAVSLEQLSEYQFVRYSTRKGLPSETEKILEETDFEWQCVVTTPASYSLFEMVRQGLGTTIVASMLLDSNDSTGLVYRPLMPSRSIKIAANHRKGDKLSPAAREFLNCITDYFID